jgi:hypothetical protein
MVSSCRFLLHWVLAQSNWDMYCNEGFGGYGVIWNSDNVGPAYYMHMRCYGASQTYVEGWVLLRSMQILPRQQCNVTLTIHPIAAALLLKCLLTGTLLCICCQLL